MSAFSIKDDSHAGCESAGCTSVALGALDPSTLVVGANVGTNGRHAWLRFDTVSLPRDETIVESRLTLYVSGAHDGSAKNNVGCDWYLWASEHGHTFNGANFNQAATNRSVGNLHGAGTRRVKLAALVAGGVELANNEAIEIIIPSTFINPGDTDGVTRWGLGNSYSDFEVRPSISTAPSASQTLELHMTGAAAAYQPTLSGVTLTDDELEEENTYRPTAFGAQSYAAFALETTAGTPVKALNMLDATDISIEPYGASINSSALTKARARPVKKGIGRAGAGGSVTFECTPERCWSVLPMILKHQQTITTPSAPSAAEDSSGVLANGAYKYKVVFVTPIGDSRASTHVSVTTVGGFQVNLTDIPTGVSGVVTARKIYRTAAGGSVYYLLTTLSDNTTTTFDDDIADATLTNEDSLQLLTPDTNFNIHAFKVGPGEDVKTATFVTRKGFTRRVYPGCMLSSIGFNVRPDAAVMATAAIEARNEHVLDAEAAGGDDDAYVLASTASFDSVANGMLTYTGAKVLLDGRESGAAIQDFNFTIQQNVGEIRGANRRRGPARHYTQGLTVGVGFRMHFENEARLRKYFGVTHKQFPMSMEQARQIQFEEVVMRMAGGEGQDRDNPEQEVIFVFPELAYDAIPHPVSDDGPIILDCTATGHVDQTHETNIWCFVKNEEASTVFDPSTDYLTVLPAGE